MPENTMSIEVQIADLLKESMRNRDMRTADCVRMIKTKHMERRTASGFKGPLDDALWLDVIASYQKQLRKSREEYVAIGERGAASLPQLDFEIELCGRFLPQAAGEDEVRAAVLEAIARLAVTDAKQIGRLVGEIMKANKGRFDPAMVKRLAEQELTPKT
ncbi:MAG: GatB/YqeY domain-containing protein [Deltaproteobacteria bacterium]|nr:GatB/YqeY domain-containing protein [Deltaproteobacteria bacterium]